MNFHFDNEMLNSSLFKNFIKNDGNNNLFTSYINDPTDKKKFLLDQAFQKYTKKALVVSYIKKVIHYESRRFDKNIRKLKRNEPLIIDKSDSSLIDSLKDIEAEKKLEQIEENCMGSFITDDLLNRAIHTLTERQQKILYFYYSLKLSDIEIAERYNVSQQAISKSRKQAISKLKRVYSNEEMIR